MSHHSEMPTPMEVSGSWQRLATPNMPWKDEGEVQREGPTLLLAPHSNLYRMSPATRASRGVRMYSAARANEASTRTGILTNSNSWIVGRISQTVIASHLAAVQHRCEISGLPGRVVSSTGTGPFQLNCYRRAELTWRRGRRQHASAGMYRQKGCDRLQEDK